MKSLAATLLVLVAAPAFAATADARPAHGKRARFDAVPPAPDQVLQWNQTLLQVLQTPGAQPATVHSTRSMAITQLAVYDAVNAIEGGFAPYALQHPAPRAASPDAAAASAAHAAMLALFPSQQPAIEAKFQDSLAHLGDSAQVRQGIRVGTDAADAVLVARDGDGADAAPPPFDPQPGPGEYQLTPPGFQAPVFTHWGAVRPFALSRSDQFRPPAPPAVDSSRYTADFNEVKALGEANSATRTPDQTDIGRFWGAAPIQNVWNQVAQAAAIENHDTLAQNARLFALVNTSMADGAIAMYDAKYAYHRWRPITAIRAAGSDGNADTAGDPGWSPLAVTALDPSYPGAHATISQAAATTLRALFGSDDVSLSLTNPSLPAVTRSFQSFSQAAAEASASRIYAGQHFRYDEDAGQALGDAVGGFVAGHLLAPVDHGR
jgi:PAP2 superfamily protein